jgi:hypothetical protein
MKNKSNTLSMMLIASFGLIVSVVGLSRLSVLFGSDTSSNTSDTLSGDSSDTSSLEDSSSDTSSDFSQYFSFYIEFSGCVTTYSSDPVLGLDSYVSFGFGNDGSIDYSHDDIIFLGNVGGVIKDASETTSRIYDALMFDEAYVETRVDMLAEFDVSIGSGKITFVRKITGPYDLEISYSSVNFQLGYEPEINVVVINEVF